MTPLLSLTVSNPPSFLSCFQAYHFVAVQSRQWTALFDTLLTNPEFFLVDRSVSLFKGSWKELREWISSSSIAKPTLYHRICVMFERNLVGDMEWLKRKTHTKHGNGWAQLRLVMAVPQSSSAVVEPCSTPASPAKSSAVPRNRRIADPSLPEDPAEQHPHQRRSSSRCSV